MVIPVTLQPQQLQTITKAFWREHQRSVAAAVTIFFNRKYRSPYRPPNRPTDPSSSNNNTTEKERKKWHPPGEMTKCFVDSKVSCTTQQHVLLRIMCLRINRHKLLLHNFFFSNNISSMCYQYNSLIMLMMVTAEMASSSHPPRPRSIWSTSMYRN